MESRVLEWRDWLSVKHAETTIAGYVWEVLRLARHFEQRAIEELTTADLLSYLAARRAGGCGNAAIRHAVNALRSFYAFACPGASPAASLPVPSGKPAKQPRTLTGAQALAVLSSCDTSSPVGARDLALLSVMLDSGLRAAEICRLRLDALDLSGRVLRVIVKGGQEQFGVFGLETANYVSAWLGWRATIARPDVATVFVGVGGLHPGRGLTTDGLRCIFRRIGRSAGLPAFSPHDLRRTGATLASLLGAPTRLVQVWGRWDDVRMVERYTAAIKAQDFAPYFPVSNVLNLKPDG